MNMKYATGVVNPKTTAIFFDKIWVPSYEIFINEEEKEFFKKIPKEVIMTFPFEKYRDKWDRIFRYATIKNHNWNYFELTALEYMYSEWRNKSLLQITNIMQNILKVDIIPIFFDKTDFERSTNVYDDKEVFLTNNIEFIIKDIPLILEKELEWEQVLDFRRDKKCMNSAKRLMRWSNIECNGLTRNDIREKLEQELDEYSFSIKKHGIQIVTGALSTILSSSTAITDIINGDNNALFVGASSISAALITYTVDRVISSKELHRSPVACLYNLKNM